MFCRRAQCLIYIICVCLRIVVSNTYCVVFLLCLSSSCVPRVARFSGMSILDYPFVLPGSLDCPFFITPSVSLTFIETHKKIICLSLWQTNRRIEQIYKDFGCRHTLSKINTETVSFIGGWYRRKPLTCRKLQTHFIT